MIEAWTAAGQGKAVEVPEPAVLAAFDLVKQVDPATGEAGAVVLDVLRLLAFERDRPPSHRRVRPRLGARPRARPGGVVALRRALSRPAAAAAARNASRPGDWSGSLTGPGAPGSWGGHAVDIVRYGAETLTAVTWGRLQELTWSFLERYCDEAYCILSVDFLDGDRRAERVRPGGAEGGARADHRLVGIPWPHDRDRDSRGRRRRSDPADARPDARRRGVRGRVGRRRRGRRSPPSSGRPRT